jgi:hypothetical protein
MVGVELAGEDDGERKMGRMHRRSLNLARGVIPIPKLSKCIFRSLNLLIVSPKLQGYFAEFLRESCKVQITVV